MHECLSTHDNPSVQSKYHVSLKPVSLKPFYIKPYLTHESEIKFAEAEMEQLRQMGILCQSSSEFLSPIMLIKRSNSGAKLAKGPEYHLVVDFKYLNLHLPDIKFSYPEIKHVLHKIGRHCSRVFRVLDLKHAFHSIILTEESKQYTSCSASPGSPTYQYNKLSEGLNVSPAYFTFLMDDLLHELPSDIREYIDCIMYDVIVFTPDIKTNKKVIKSFMYMLKKYCMLLTINKIHAFRSKVKYMGLLLSSKDNLPTITPLGSHVKAISTLPVPITARGIKSFIGCFIYLAQFLPKLLELIKPINDIIRKCNKVDKSDKISTLPTYAKGKGKVKSVLRIFKSIGCLSILPILKPLKVSLYKLRSCIYLHDQDASILSVTLVLCTLAQFYTKFKMVANMSLHSIELCGLKKSLLHFQCLLNYSSFTVLKDHSALKRIYCSHKPAKTVRPYSDIFGGNFRFFI